MAKAAQKTLWEQIKEIWAEQAKEFLSGWKPLWDEYKTVIGPFVKGTFAYIWKIVSGLISGISCGIYESGKAILNWLLEIIRKA